MEEGLDTDTVRWKRLGGLDEKRPKAGRTIPSRKKFSLRKKRGR